MDQIAPCMAIKRFEKLFCSKYMAPRINWEKFFLGMSDNSEALLNHSKHVSAAPFACQLMVPKLALGSELTLTSTS